MELLIQRSGPKSAAATAGSLYVNGAFECFTLELAIRDGGPGSAISAGTFRVTINWSEHFQRMMPEILDVPGRTAIRIHWGNTTRDTDGCVMTGEKQDGLTILGSKVAFDAFFVKLQAAIDRDDPVTIEIREGFPGA